MLIALDFDGTCVKHEYPEIGADIGAIPVLKKLIENGNQLSLWTIRSGKELQKAVDWFAENEIPLFSVNVNPGQKSWSSSPKFYAPLYIDDAALGAPLISEKDGRPYLDWDIVERLLKEKNIL